METKMSRGGVLASLVLTLSMLVARGSTAEQYLPANVPQSSPMIGHVLARIEGLAHLGGQRYEVFIFGIDKWERYGKSAAPVKVVHEVYRDEPNLPEKFFDFSSRYKLTVVRDTKCDESVQSLSFEASISDSGKPLPAAYVLKVLDGAPTDVLKPDLILPCFVLRPGQYKVVSKGETL